MLWQKHQYFLTKTYLYLWQQQWCCTSLLTTKILREYTTKKSSLIKTKTIENIKNANSKWLSPHCAGSCISYFSVYNKCVEFGASGLGTGLNRDPFKAETTYSHDPSLTSHLSLGLIHPCTITALSMCSSKIFKNKFDMYIAHPKFYCSLEFAESQFWRVAWQNRLFRYLLK